MANTEAQEDAVGSAVPIHTKVTANQEMLYSLLSDQPLPPDDFKHHTFLKPKLLSPQSNRYSQFSDLLISCIAGTRGKRGPNS